MKIWIDGYEANVPQRLGSGQVAFNLLKTLEKLDKTNDYTILLPTPPIEDMPKERSGFRYRLLKPKPFWTWIALPLALIFAKGGPDLFFSPTHYTAVLSRVKKINMIFDTAYLHFPQYFKPRDLWQLKLWTWLSVKVVTKVITISQSTKNDCLKYYGFDKKDVVVAYPGYDKETYRPITNLEKIKEIKEKYEIRTPYILFIGTLQPRKNLIRLIEAFQKIENLKLVIVGKTTGLGRGGWMFEEILQKPKELGIEDKIIFTGFVPGEEMPYLVCGAQALVQPSLYEGFGMTAVEAMACGTPVIVSNVSSLPEAVGKAGLLIDPNSVDQIEQAIRAISNDKKLKAKMSRLGLEQAKQFSWEKMTKIVLKVFEETVNA